MTIAVELTPEQKANLDSKARADGIEPAEYIVRLIDQAVPADTLVGRL